MSRIITVGTGSKGNTYALCVNDEILILDLGKPLMDLKKAINFETHKIVGCLVTHRHKDHARFLNQYESLGIPIFKPYIDYKKSVSYGGFTVKPFRIEHGDTVNYGFYISHKEMGTMVYATDMEKVAYRNKEGILVSWKFKNVDYALIECNYSLSDIVKEEFKNYNYKHILTGHHSLEALLLFLRDHKHIKHVILCHISNTNGNSDKYVREVSKLVKNVNIARKNNIIELEIDNE